MASPDPRPETIDKLASAVYPSFAMLAGMQLDLFTSLKDGPMNAAHIADALGVRPDKLKLLLYALSAADLLLVEGDLFSNSLEADQFLVRGKHSYISDGWHQAIGRRWNGVLKTAETIRTGVPQQKTDFATMSSERMESICRSFESETVAVARELITRHDFSYFRTLLDVGGAGYLSIVVTAAYPHLRATVVDLPSITPIEQRIMSEAGAGNRVQVIETDVVNNTLAGSYDAAVLANLIQVLSADQARRVLKNVSEVIEPGGSLFIVGRIIDDSRITPMELVCGSNLVFLNAYDEGEAYSECDHREWLSEAGFEDFERVVLPNKESIIRARKPG